jgi:hypothetical protein
MGSAIVTDATTTSTINPSPTHARPLAAALRCKANIVAAAPAIAEDWHHRIYPKQRPPEINRVLVDWHSPPQIGSLDSENKNSTGPEATGDQHNPGADLRDCHALHLRMVAMVRACFHWLLLFEP